MEEKKERARSEYHTKRFPHTVCIRLNDEQYQKIQDDTSGIVRSLINNYEAVLQPEGADSGNAEGGGVPETSEAITTPA